MWSRGVQGAADWHPAPKPVLEAAAEARRATEAHGVDIGTLAIKESVAAQGVAVHLMGMKTVEEVGVHPNSKTPLPTLSIPGSHSWWQAKICWLPNWVFNTLISTEIRSSQGCVRASRGVHQSMGASSSCFRTVCDKMTPCLLVESYGETCSAVKTSWACALKERFY